MTRKKNNWLTGLLLLICAVTSAVVWKTYQHSGPPDELLGVLRTEARPLQSFNLIDQSGRPFTEKNLQGQWSMVFFGYTSCPDICPATLAMMNATYRLLQEEASEYLKDTGVVFVSVDPERDTPEKIADYVQYFNKEFTGVTGDREMIDRFVLSSGAGYYIEEESAPDQYLVAHSSAIFLIDPALKVVAAFSQPHQPKTIASQYQKIRAYFSGR